MATQFDVARALASAALLAALAVAQTPASALAKTPLAPAALGLAPRPSFEPNRGQADPSVRYLARARGYDLFLTGADAVLALRSEGAQAALRMRIEGARGDATLEGVDPLAGRSNYLIGDDPARWQRDVPHFARVAAREVVPGVDWIFRGAPEGLAYDLVVAPGAEPTALRLVFDGATALSLDAAGRLRVATPAGELIQHAPLLYQEIDGVRHPVAGGFRIAGERRVAFSVGDYDHGAPLWIDPVVEWATYLGTPFGDAIYGIAVGAGGNSYVTGVTGSASFPHTIGAFQGMLVGDLDGFVTKLAPDGATLVYSTFYGGTGHDVSLAIAIDPAGNAYICGSTGSFNLPLVNAAQPIAVAFPEA